MSKSNAFVKITKWASVFIGTGLGLMSKFSTWRLIIKSCLIGASLIAILTEKVDPPDVVEILNRQTNTTFFRPEWELRTSYIKEHKRFYECFLLNNENIDTVDVSLLNNDKCPKFDREYEDWLDRLDRSYRYTELFPKDVYDNYCIKDTKPSEKYMWAYFQYGRYVVKNEETGEAETVHFSKNYLEFMENSDSLVYFEPLYYLVLYDPVRMFIGVAAM